MQERTSLKAQNRERSSKHRRGWRVTPRDLDILVAIYRFRFLTRQLVEWAFFSREDGDFNQRSSLAARRLQVLFEAGYVQRLVMPVLPGTGRSPAVYALNSRGADAVAVHLGVDRGEVDWTPKHNRATAFFMEHTMAIARLWASLTAALRGTGFRIGLWEGEAELRRWEMRGYDRESGRTIPIRPDGYMELMWPDESFAPFFIEVDMGTETNTRVGRKMGAYGDLRREGTRQEWDLAKFYVLIVTSGHRRMENLRRVARKAGAQRFCFFATLEDLHPSRVLTAWHNANNKGIRLIGSSERESGGEEGKQKDGEEPGDNEIGKREDFAEGRFDAVKVSYQVDKDEEDDDASHDHGAYYDDEDPETWPE